MRPSRAAPAAAVLLLAAIGLYSFLVAKAGTFPGDVSAADRIRGHGLPLSLAPAPAFVTGLFGLAAVAPIAAVTVAGFWALVRDAVSLRAANLTVLAAAAPVATTTWKVVLGPVPLDRGTFPGGGATYPSGHVAYAVGLCGFLAVLAWRHGRRDLVCLALAVIAAMGPMRIWNGEHLPSDVVGGYLLGGAWLCGVLALEGRARGSVG